MVVIESRINPATYRTERLRFNSSMADGVPACEIAR